MIATEQTQPAEHIVLVTLHRGEKAAHLLVTEKSAAAAFWARVDAARATQPPQEGT